MKIILREPLHMAKFAVVFPADIELNVLTYGGEKLIQHPTRESLLTKLPSNKESYIVVPYFEIIKYFPHESRQDFFKYIIVDENGKIWTDWEGKEMYFEEFQLSQAEIVLESINKVNSLNHEFSLSSTREA